MSAPELLTLADTRELLLSVQPTISRKFGTDGPYASLTLGSNVFEDFKSKKPKDVIPASIKIGVNTWNLTKEAMIRISALIGLREAYIIKTPPEMVQEALNYHLSHGGVSYETLRLQGRGDIVHTFIQGDALSISSTNFLDDVAQYMTDDPDSLDVDFKLSNTTSRTAVRLISSETVNIGTDVWSPGIQITNSMTANPSSRPSMTGVMFNRTTSSTSLSSHARSGVYDRRSFSTDEDEFNEWVSVHAQGIMSGLSVEFESIKTLLDLDLTGQLGDTMTDLFRTLKVPARVRPIIYNAVINQESRSGYMLMQAIAESANTEGLDDEMATRTMAVAGALPHLLSDRCDSCHKVNV